MSHKELLALGMFGPKSRIGDRIEMLLKRGRTFSPRASLGRVVASAIVLLMLLIAASFAPRWIAFAQQEPRPSFEVASIKPSPPGGGLRRVLLIEPGGVLRAANVTPKMLIAFAYHLTDFQISGGPKWLNSDRYDINAKPDPSSHEPAILGKMTPEQGRGFQNRSQQRVQMLLEDRFHFQYHRESKDLPIYALVVAKNGPKFKLAAPPDAQERQASGELPMDPRKAPPGGTRFGRGQITARGVSLTTLANWLSGQLGRTVVNKTGLNREYDFTLKWTPEPQSDSVAGAAPSSDTNGPSIFTALEEQLGLKLESTKGPVEILVIDHAEKPTEN